MSKIMLSNYGVILAAYVISLIKIDILISDFFCKFSFNCFLMFYLYVPPCKLMFDAIFFNEFCTF